MLDRLGTALLAAFIRLLTRPDHPQQRRDTLTHVVAALELEDRPGGRVDVSQVQSKSDFPHFVKTGTLPVPRPEALERLHRVLADMGFEVTESRAEDVFLGWVVIAEREDQVFHASVGSRGLQGGSTTTYPPLGHGVYLQLSVARKGSNLAWTR